MLFSIDGYACTKGKTRGLVKREITQKKRNLEKKAIGRWEEEVIKMTIRVRRVKVGVSGKFSPVYGNVTFSLGSRRQRRRR
jgi:hypothetical protein